MAGELPPQHHRSAPSQSEKMPNDQNRLPSIAELHSSLQPLPSAHIYSPTNTSSHPRRDPVLRQPLDGAFPSSTSLTGPLPEHQPSGTASSESDPKLSSWTAINRSFHSSGLASSSSDQSEQLTHRQQSGIPDSFASTNLRVQAATYRPNSWPPPSAFKQESVIAEKPITAGRQDSAVSENTASPALRSLPNPAFSSSIFSFRSQGNNSDSSHTHFPRNALSIQQKPPSPIPSPVPGSTLAQSHSAQNLTQSTRYSRRRKSPPESGTKDTLSVVTRRERAHSDSRVSSSYLPTTSALSPRRGILHGTLTDGNMPPPPNPPSSQQGFAPGPQVFSNGGPSAMHAHRGSPYEPRYDYSVATQAASQDPSTVVFGNSIPSRCLHCHEVWTYPPPDTSSIHQSPSTSLSEMEQRMQAIPDLLKQYNEQKDKSYQEWVQWHKVEPGHPDTVVPCMRGSSIPNNKRKSNVPVDDGQVSSKLRRLSFNTPSPRPSQHQLTPPPEPASTSPAANQSATVERAYPYAEMSSGDTIYVSDRVATILGLQGAPPAKYEKPADDSSNMWSDPVRERKSASVEHQPSEKAVSRTAGSPSEVEAGK